MNHTAYIFPVMAYSTDGFVAAMPCYISVFQGACSCIMTVLHWCILLIASIWGNLLVGIHFLFLDFDFDLEVQNLFKLVC